MADTPSYVRGAASGFLKVFGLQTAWTDEFVRLYGQTPVDGKVTAGSVTGDQVPVTLSGRSIYYGTFLYLSYLLGSVWLAVVAQSLIAAASIYLTVRLIARSLDVRLPASAPLWIGLVIAAVTPFGYFVGYLMPDIFGALSLLATANLLFLWRWQANGERAFWIVLLGFSLLSHNVNTMLVTGLALVSCAIAWLTRARVARASLATVAGCVLLAVLGQLGFVLMVDHFTGQPPIRPPFVAMRQIADGPGYAYLRDRCGKERYFYCRVLAQKDPQHDELLWSMDRNVSLFRGLTPAEQRISAAEQPKFLKGLLADRPLQVLGSVVSDTWEQLLNIDTNVNFNYFGPSRARFQETIPADLFGPITQTRAFQKSMPVSLVEAMTGILALLSFAGLLAAAIRGFELRRELRAYCWCLLVGVFINAAICGALSGPKGRYEARLIWVLPLAALTIGAGMAQRKRRAAAA